MQAGRRLPTVAELQTFRLRQDLSGAEFTSHVWFDANGSSQTQKVMLVDRDGRQSVASGSAAFRCVAPPGATRSENNPLEAAAQSDLRNAVAAANLCAAGNEGSYTNCGTIAQLEADGYQEDPKVTLVITESRWPSTTAAAAPTGTTPKPPRSYPYPGSSSGHKNEGRLQGAPHATKGSRDVPAIPKAYHVTSMAYAVGQTIEVYLEFDLPPAQGVRLVVATFANERGDVVELTDDPAEGSWCFVQRPTQSALRGRAAQPGFYELERLRVEHLWGVTHMDPPGIGFEVKSTPEVVAWSLR